MIRLDKRPEIWEDHLALFIAHLISVKTQSGTIKSYISAIKAVLKLDGIVMGDDNFRLAAVTRACKLENDRVKARLPISKNLLRIILEKVSMMYEYQPYLEALFKAILTIVYYGLLRIGELTTSPYCLKASAIHSATNKDKIQIILQSSKTHGAGDELQIIKICGMSEKEKSLMDLDSHCPFKLIWNYVNA